MLKVGVNEFYKQAIYNMLSESYREYKNIALDDIENLYDETGETKIFINKALEYSISNNTTIYFVEGENVLYKDFSKKSFKIAVIINTNTSTFAILPWDYIEQIGLNNVKVGDKVDINKFKYEIEKNKNNTFEYQDSSNESMSREYFSNYQFRLLHNKEMAYAQLNEEYSKAKFDKIEDFEKYVTNNIMEFSKSNMSAYQVSSKENYTQYICVDENKRYYIFRAKSIFDYDVILDTYTIDIPEFTTKYNEAGDREKVVLNINKFMLALNDKDYKYAYSVLANSFKEKNFPTYESFEQYVKSNFFEKNKFDYIEFGNEAGTYYTYEINITDETGKSNKTVTKTFIMLLNEGTKFEISFNV